MVGKGASDGMKELAKQAKDAAESTKKFGLQQMWILRSATSGGAPGLVGGGIGAALGLIPGIGFGVAAGAMIGNWAGQMAGGAYSRFAGKNAADVEMGSPGLAYLREVAERDRSAAAGRNYRDTYRQGTAVQRAWADFHASGGESMGGSLGNQFDRVTDKLSKWLLGVERAFQGIDVKEGAGKGLAPGPLHSRLFGSVADAHNAAVVAAMAATFGAGGGGFSSSGARGPVADRAIRATSPYSGGLTIAAMGEFNPGELRVPFDPTSARLQRDPNGRPVSAMGALAPSRQDRRGEYRGGPGPMDSGPKMGGPEEQARAMDQLWINRLDSSVLT
jgi:hypothetical protein